MEETKVKYKILYGSFRTELEKLVQHYLDRGWELQGGVSLTERINTEMWAQAIIKR